MTGEVGELAELFQWRGEVAVGLTGWTAADRERVGEEMSDVLLYLLRLSDVCGVDLGAAVQAKVAKNAVKYPADRARGRSDKYTVYQQEEAKEREMAEVRGEKERGGGGGGEGGEKDEANGEKRGGEKDEVGLEVKPEG